MAHYMHYLSWLEIIFVEKFVEWFWKLVFMKHSREQLQWNLIATSRSSSVGSSNSSFDASESLPLETLFWLFIFAKNKEKEQECDKIAAFICRASCLYFFIAHALVSLTFRLFEHVGTELLGVTGSPGPTVRYRDQQQRAWRLDFTPFE